MSKLDTLFKACDKQEIELYPYQKKRIENTYDRLLMSEDKINSLSKEDLKKYVKALYEVQNEHAGGYDGWSQAHDKLVELGAKLTEVHSGHRVFQSIRFAEDN